MEYEDLIYYAEQILREEAEDQNLDFDLLAEKFVAEIKQHHVQFLAEEWNEANCRDFGKPLGPSMDD